MERDPQVTERDSQPRLAGCLQVFGKLEGARLLLKLLSGIFFESLCFSTTSI